MFIIIVFDYVLAPLLLFLRRISTVLSQGISHGMWLLAWEFLSIKSVLHFAFLHLLSGYYYYDYVVICVLRQLWFTEILFRIGLLLSKEVNQLNIIIIIGCDRPSDFIFSFQLCFFQWSRLSSYHLRLFLCLISFLLFPCLFRSCLSSCVLRLSFYLISFLLFPCVSVWENTRVWVPHIVLALPEVSPIKISSN